MEPDARLRADLHRVRAYTDHRQEQFRYATSWPACPACELLLTQEVQRCPHNQEALGRFITGFKNQLEDSVVLALRGL